MLPQTDMLYFMLSSLSSNFYAYFGSEEANCLFNLLLIFLYKICTYMARLYAKKLKNVLWEGPSAPM